MSSRASTFRLNNVKRAVLGAQKAGIEVGSLTIDAAGTISITPKQQLSESAKPAPKTPVATGLREWD